MKSSLGFTLIELLITIVIISVLAAVAVPSYNAHITKTKRSEAKTELMTMLQQQQRYYTDNASYTADLKDLGYSASSAVATENALYKITASTCATPYPTDISDCVKLTAAAQGTQASDGNLVVNSRGLESPADKW